MKNENNEIILFILNLEDITDAPVRSDHCRNSLKNSKYSKYSVCVGGGGYKCDCVSVCVCVCESHL